MTKPVDKENCEEEAASVIEGCGAFAAEHDDQSVRKSFGRAKELLALTDAAELLAALKEMNFCVGRIRQEEPVYRVYAMMTEKTVQALLADGRIGDAKDAYYDFYWLWQEEPGNDDWCLLVLCRGALAIEEAYLQKKDVRQAVIAFGYFRDVYSRFPEKLLEAPFRELVVTAGQAVVALNLKTNRNLAREYEIVKQFTDAYAKVAGDADLFVTAESRQAEEGPGRQAKILRARVEVAEDMVAADAAFDDLVDLFGSHSRDDAVIEAFAKAVPVYVGKLLDANGFTDVSAFLGRWEALTQRRKRAPFFAATAQAYARVVEYAHQQHAEDWESMYLTKLETLSGQQADPAIAEALETAREAVAVEIREPSEFDDLPEDDAINRAPDRALRIVDHLENDQLSTAEDLHDKLLELAKAFPESDGIGAIAHNVKRSFAGYWVHCARPERAEAFDVEPLIRETVPTEKRNEVEPEMDEAAVQHLKDGETALRQFLNAIRNGDDEGAARLISQMRAIVERSALSALQQDLQSMYFEMASYMVEQGDAAAAKQTLMRAIALSDGSESNRITIIKCYQAQISSLLNQGEAQSALELFDPMLDVCRKCKAGPSLVDQIVHVIYEGLSEQLGEVEANAWIESLREIFVGLPDYDEIYAKVLADRLSLELLNSPIEVYGPTWTDLAEAVGHSDYANIDYNAFSQVSIELARNTDNLRLIRIMADWFAELDKNAARRPGWSISCLAECYRRLLEEGAPGNWEAAIDRLVGRPDATTVSSLAIVAVLMPRYEKALDDMHDKPEDQRRRSILASVAAQLAPYLWLGGRHAEARTVMDVLRTLTEEHADLRDYYVRALQTSIRISSASDEIQFVGPSLLDELGDVLGDEKMRSLPYLRTASLLARDAGRREDWKAIDYWKMLQDASGELKVDRELVRAACGVLRLRATRFLSDSDTPELVVMEEAFEAMNMILDIVEKHPKERWDDLINWVPQQIQYCAAHGEEEHAEACFGRLIHLQESESRDLHLLLGKTCERLLAAPIEVELARKAYFILRRLAVDPVKSQPLIRLLDRAEQQDVVQQFHPFQADRRGILEAGCRNGIEVELRSVSSLKRALRLLTAFVPGLDEADDLPELNTPEGRPLPVCNWNITGLAPSPLATFFDTAASKPELLQLCNKYLEQVIERNGQGRPLMVAEDSCLGIYAAVASATHQRNKVSQFADFIRSLRPLRLSCGLRCLRNIGREHNWAHPSLFHLLAEELVAGAMPKDVLAIANAGLEARLSKDSATFREALEKAVEERDGNETLRSYLDALDPDEFPWTAEVLNAMVKDDIEQ